MVTMLCLVADIPECERELDDCDPNANCMNTFGSYSCICNTGFTGDGFNCSGQYSQHPFVHCSDILGSQKLMVIV